MGDMRTKEDDRRLHRLHDGELEVGARAAVEAALTDEDRVRLAALDDLGRAIRDTLSAEAEGFDVAAAIMAALPTPLGSAKRSRMRVVMASRAMWASTLVAAAAAMALWVAPWRGESVSSDGCQIESIEVSGASATVLNLPDALGKPTGTVVWLDEEEQ